MAWTCGRVTAYMYRGLGTSEESAEMLLKSLRHVLSGSHYTVQEISPQQIIQGDWQKDAALLAVGGGYDRGYIQALGPQGVATVRQYVRRGGSYLGLCAGAYFACDEIEFDKGGPMEVCGNRDLNFYSGVCVGPAFPGFQYKSHAGAHAARISWLPNDLIRPPLQDFTCYFNGGGYFLPHSRSLKVDNSAEFPRGSSDSCRALAVYEDLPGRPTALVHCEVGAGRAMLCGTHPEYRVSDLDRSDTDLINVLPHIDNEQEKCDTTLKALLSLLGIKFDTNVDASPSNKL